MYESGRYTGMKALLVALWGFVAVASVAATCVSNVEQKGPTGPWVGEVVNTGPDAVQDVYVNGRVRGYSDIGGGTCPSSLLPGERGAFEVFFDQGFNPPPVLPLDVYFPPTAFAAYPSTGFVQNEGLLLTIVEENRAEKYARIVVQNGSQHRYADINICGILRGEDGRVAAVGQTEVRVVGGLEPPDDPAWLQPGQSLTLDVYFYEMPLGTLRFHARADRRYSPPPFCCFAPQTAWTSVDAGPFSLMLPPGWVYEPGQGIDSFVGTIRGDGVEMYFDYGIYSNDLPAQGDPAHNVTFETIGGFTAKIVTPAAADGTTGVFFADTGETLRNQAVQLQLSGMSLPTSERDLAVIIFRTIRFH